METHTYGGSKGKEEMRHDKAICMGEKFSKNKISTVMGDDSLLEYVIEFLHFKCDVIKILL